MRYRRDGKNPKLRWRKRNYLALIDAGVPGEIIDDDNAWRYVLAHGDDDFGTGWSASDLTIEESKRLLKLLRLGGFYEWTDGGMGLIHELKLRNKNET
jgi:hypothetical protein